MKAALGRHAPAACNFLSPFRKGEEESNPNFPVAGAAIVRKRAMKGFSSLARRNQPVNDNAQDGAERPVIIITGRVWKRKGGKSEGVHVMLTAPDDDSAVRRALESLAAEGYAEAELDQIGEMEGEPDEEPHLSAYQGALEGEVSIVTFEEPL
jgi:hypothetical protein